MRLRLVLVFALVALLLFVGDDGLCAAAKKSKKKRKKGRKTSNTKQPKSVSVTKFELCHACVATLEQYQKSIEAEVTAQQRAGQRAYSRDRTGTVPRTDSLKIDGNKIANELCFSERFEPYSDAMRHGCMKLMQDHFKEVIGGMEGDQLVGVRSYLLDHKKKACTASGACTGKMADWVTQTRLETRDACSACKLVVEDLDQLLFREREPIPSKKRLAALIENLCEDLNLRHEDPAFLEEHCVDLVDDLQGDAMREEDSALVRNIKLRKRIESAGMKLSASLANKVCEELQGYCSGGGGEAGADGAV
eukprot:g6437.t1